MKLSPVIVSLARNANGWSSVDELKEDVWVVKNHNGTYTGKAYRAKILHVVKHANMVGLAVLVETCVDNYLAFFCDMDIIGATEEDCLKNYQRCLQKQSESNARMSKFKKGLF